MGIEKVRIVNFPKIVDSRGNLTFIEGGRHLPYEFKRVYYLYDIPGGAVRGGHAHKKCHETLIAMNGSFDVIVDDGIEKRRIHLNRSYYGVHIPEMIWRELDNFSTGAICLVIASDFYDEEDYIRDYDEFLEALGLKGKKGKE